MDKPEDMTDADDIIGTQAPVTPVVKVSPVVVTITKPAPVVVPVTAAPDAVDDLLNDIPSYPTAQRSNVTMELAAMCFGRG